MSDKSNEGKGVLATQHVGQARGSERELRAGGIKVSDDAQTCQCGKYEVSEARCDVRRPDGTITRLPQRAERQKKAENSRENQ